MSSGSDLLIAAWFDEDLVTPPAGGSTYTLTAATGSFTLPGQAAALKVGHVLTAAAGSFALTGVAAALKRGYTLTAAPGSFALTGQAATLVYTAGGTNHYTLAAATGSFGLTGQAATLTRSYRLSCAAGSFSVTGQAADLVHATASSSITTGGTRRPRTRLPAPMFFTPAPTLPQPVDTVALARTRRRRDEEAILLTLL